MTNGARVQAEGVHGGVLRFIVPNGTALSKGWLMVANAAVSRGAVPHSTNPTVRPLGITMQSKDVNDGIVTVGLQRSGRALMYADGVITTGDVVVAGAVANRVRRMNTTAGGLSYQEINAIVGRALENAVDGGQLMIDLLLSGVGY